MPQNLLLEFLDEDENNQGASQLPVLPSTVEILEELEKENQEYERYKTSMTFANTLDFANEWDQQLEQDTEEYNFAKALAERGFEVPAEEEDPYGFFDAASDFGVGLIEGFQEGVNNTTTLIERGVNFTFDTELDIPEFDVTVPETLPGQIGGVVGQIGEALIPGTAAVKLLRVPGLVKFALSKTGLSAKAVTRLTSAITAEGTLVIGEQFAFDPNDPILANLIQEYPQVQNPITEYLATDPMDSESMNRFRLALEGIGLGALANTVFHYVGKAFASKAAARPNFIRNVDRELIGLGDSARSKQFAFEEYLLDKGVGANKVINRVRGALQNGTIDDVVRSTTGRNPREVYEEIRRNPDVFERILARQLAENNTNISPALAAHNARVLQGKGQLGKLVENMSGRTTQDFLDSATGPIVNPPKRGRGDIKNLIRKTLELSDVAKSRFIRSDLVIDNFQRKALGFGSEPAELKKRLRQGIKGLEQTPAVMSDKLNNQTMAVAEGFLDGGELFSPMLPTKRGIREPSGADSLTNIFLKENLDKEEADRFLRYVAAKRAEVLRKRKIPSPYQFDPENGAIAAAGDNNQLYQKILPEYTKRSYAQLEYARRAGLLSIEDVLRITSAGKDDVGQLWYIPNFVDPDSNKFKSLYGAGKGNPFKTIEGNVNLPMQNLMEADARYTYGLAYKGEVNLFKQSLYDLVDRFAASANKADRDLANSFATKVDMTKVQKDRKLATDIKNEVKRRLRILTQTQSNSSLNQDIIQITGKPVDDLTTEELLKVIPSSDRLSTKSGDFDIVLRDGKPQLYRIEDNLLKEYVEFLGASNAQELSGILGDTLEKFKEGNKFFGSAIIREPSFVMVNALRDTISASVNSPFGFIPLAHTAKGFNKLVSDKDFYRELIANGATGATRGETIGRKIRTFGKIAKGDPKRTFSRLVKTNLVKRMTFGGAKYYSDMATRIEASSRAAEYMLAKKYGASPELAGHFANEVSTNFLKSGTSRAFNNFADHTVFLNASLQGFYKFARNLRANPEKALVGVFAYALWDFANDDLSRDFDEYRLIDEDTKSLHTVIPNPIDNDQYIDWLVGGKQGEKPALDPEVPFFVLPIPYDYGAAGKILNNAVRNAAGDEATSDVRNALGRFITTVMPAIGFPTFLRPYYEIARNKDAFDRDIVPEFYQGDKNIEHLYRANTNNIAIFISDASKKLNSLFREGEGEAFIHPLVAEHWINSHTPGLISYVRGIVDRMTRPEDFGASPLTPEGQKGRTVNPLVFALDGIKSRFLLGQGELRAGDQTLYDLKDAAETIKKSRQNLERRVNNEIFQKTIVAATGEEKKVLEVYPSVRAMANYVSILNSKQEFISKHKDYTPEEKQKQIADIEIQKNETLLRFLGFLERVDPERDLKRIVQK